MCCIMGSARDGTMLGPGGAMALLAQWEKAKYII